MALFGKQIDLNTSQRSPGKSSAIDHEAPKDEDVPQCVAIKKILLNTGDVRRWVRSLREIRLMRHFDNENVTEHPLAPFCVFSFSATGTGFTRYL